MMWVFLIVVIGFGLAWAVAPREMWRITQGWQYKNSEANEPSDAAYAMWRISSIVAIVVIIVAMLALISNQNMTSKQREGERSRAVQERADREKYEVEEVQLSVFAMQARKVFGVPGSTAVIGYPHEGFCEEENWKESSTARRQQDGFLMTTNISSLDSLGI